MLFQRILSYTVEQSQCMPYGMNELIEGFTERHIRSVKHYLAAQISHTIAKIPSSPDNLLSCSHRIVSEVRLPSSAGMDPDRSDSETGHSDNNESYKICECCTGCMVDTISYPLYVVE